MTRKGGGMFADGYNQLATAQSLQSSLDSTLRETGHFGERAQTRRNRLPSASCSLSVKTKINQKRGGLAIVSNEVPHKNIDDVIVDGDFFPEARHVLKDEGRRQREKARRMKDELGRMK
jgi:hypothetical protein